MRLADDDIEIKIGQEVVRLRPTLRAAFRLERRHGGFGAIIRAVMDSNCSVIADLIREGATAHTDAPDFITYIEMSSARGLRKIIESVTEPLVEFVFALAGVDPDDLPDADAPVTGKRLTFAEHHENLFGVATGWLGWPPEAAWNSTAAEILAAQKGRIEMLKAIFGTKSSDGDASEPCFDRDPDASTTLKALARAF